MYLCCAYLVPGGPGAEGFGRKARAWEGCVAKGHGGEQQLQQDGWREAPDEDGADQGEPWSPSGSHDWASAGEGEKCWNLYHLLQETQSLTYLSLWCFQERHAAVVRKNKELREELTAWTSQKSWLSWSIYVSPSSPPPSPGPALILLRTNDQPRRSRCSKISSPPHSTPLHHYSLLSVLLVDTNIRNTQLRNEWICLFSIKCENTAITL